MRSTVVRGNVHVLSWLFSATGSALIGDILRHFLSPMCSISVRLRGFAMENLQVLLTSHVSYDMTQAEQAHVLTTTLQTVIMQRRVDLLRFLVAHGVEVDTLRVMNNCAIFNSVQVLEKLCESGVFCVLYKVLPYCRLSPDDSVAQVMLRHGMDAQASEVVYSLLHVAAEKGEFELVALYLEAGFADANAKDADGNKTPLMAALRKGPTELGECAGNPPKIVSKLLEYGANAHLRDANGATALHLAARHECDVIVPLLLEYGADPNAPDEDGYVHVVARLLNDHRHCVKLNAMVTQGGDLSVKNAALITPMDLLLENECGREWIEQRVPSIQKG